MTTSIVSSRARGLDRLRAMRVDGAWSQAGLALIIYLAVAAGLFGSPLLHRSAHECLCGPGTTDPGIYVWAFEWWPHALVHGLNPFYTHLLYAPQGIDLAHGTVVPGAAFLLWPVTAVLGPLAAFNLAMLLSPALAALFTFLLCRRITGRFWPSLVGGWLFGFSTYLLGQLTSHLNLTLVFLVPAVVHLVLRGLAGDLGRKTFWLLLTLALVLQLSFSLEVFASLTLFGVIALAVAYAAGPAPARLALRGLVAPILLAYAVSGALMSVYIYYALRSGGTPILTWRSDKFSADLLAFVVPNTYPALGGLSFTGLSGRFTAWAVEGAAYLGIPMLVMMGLGARQGWRRPGVRVMLLMLLIVLVCSLGGRLNVAGPPGVPLPWALVHRLPILGLMLPSRFVVYIALIGALLSAMWLARAGHRVWPWLLAAVSVAFLWPAIGRNYWRSKPELPPFFTSSAYRQAIGPHDIALVLPVGIAGQSMLWQAETHLGFTMAGGYVVAVEAPDPYKRYAIYPMLTYFAQVPHAVSATATFLRDQHISVVVMDLAAASMTPWVPNLARLGWRAVQRDGVVVVRPRQSPRASR